MLSLLWKHCTRATQSHFSIITKSGLPLVLLQSCTKLCIFYCSYTILHLTVYCMFKRLCSFISTQWLRIHLKSFKALKPDLHLPLQSHLKALFFLPNRLSSTNLLSVPLCLLKMLSLLLHFLAGSFSTDLSLTN